MIKTPVIQFLVMAFLFCWLAAAAIYFLEIPYGSATASIIVAFFCMPAPALSAWIMMKFILKKPLYELGVNWKLADKKALAIMPIWLLAWVIAYYCITYISSSLFGTELFGALDFSREGLFLKIEDMTEGQIDPETINIPSIPVVLSLVILGGIIAGSTINLIFTLGEEIGWRGFLYNQLKDTSLHFRVLFTGIVWGFWHAPLIAMGHNFPENPGAGIFMMVILCIALSYPMDWLRRTSNSVLGPGMFHGMINGTAAGMMLFVFTGNELLSSVVGLSGILAIGTVYLLQTLFSSKVLS
jgi:membrane protease YdiL (CAAX protease family)